jgi:hypothetical protein
LENKTEQNQQTETTQMEQELNFTFKVSEINLILSALEELPHKISRKMIDNIFAQAQTQLPKEPNKQ